MDRKLRRGLVRLTVEGPGILRLRFAPGAGSPAFDDRPSPVTAAGFKPKPGGRVFRQGQGIKAETPGLALSLDAAGILHLTGPGGSTYFKSGPSGGLSPLL